MNIFDCDGIAPARDFSFAAVKRKLFLRKNISRRLVEVDLSVRHFGQMDEAILQSEQLQIARRAVESVAAVARVHADGHVVVAELVGDVHRENSLARFKVQNDVLPHTGGQILHVAVDIARRGGELHNRRVAQVISRPDALHLIAGIGFDGIDTFDAGRDHAVALHQPVLVINVGIALN